MCVFNDKRKLINIIDRFKFSIRTYVSEMPYNAVAMCENNV